MEKTVVIIEVTHTSGARKDCKKVQTLMNDYDVEEGFVYDYKKNTWYQLDKLSGESTESSFSQVLQLDLNKFLTSNPRKG